MSSDADRNEINKQTNTAEEENDRREKSPCKLFSIICVSFSNPDNVPHYLIALFTFFLAVFACYAWVEATRGTKALQGQLKALEKDQRPWVSIEKIEITEPLVYTDPIDKTDLANFATAFTLKNVGKTPAVGIRIFGDTFVTPIEGARLDIEQQRICTEQRKFRTTGSLLSGITLFQDHNTDPPMRVPYRISREEAKKAIGKTRLIVTLLGCVEYTTSSEAEFFTTDYTRPVNPDIDVSRGNIPASELSLGSHPFGNNPH